MLPLLVGNLFGAADHREAAGVVDEDVDPAPAGEDGVHGARDVGGHRHVAAEGQGVGALAAELLDEAVERGRIHVQPGQLRALPREGAGDGGTDALSGVGDDHDLALEAAHAIRAPLASKNTSLSVRSTTWQRSPTATASSAATLATSEAGPP